jgi:hypothetical protein
MYAESMTMSMSTIRIRARSRQALKEIADATGRSMQDALDEAIEEQRRRLYLEGLNADYASLRRDTAAHRDRMKEVEAWDRANLDGLEDA